MKYQTNIMFRGLLIFFMMPWRTVKYEHVYLYVVEDGVKLYEGFKEYFSFYNHQRSNQSLGYETPGLFM